MNKIAAAVAAVAPQPAEVDATQQTLEQVELFIDDLDDEALDRLRMRINNRDISIRKNPCLPFHITMVVPYCPLRP